MYCAENTLIKTNNKYVTTQRSSYQLSSYKYITLHYSSSFTKGGDGGCLDNSLNLYIRKAKKPNINNIVPIESNPILLKIMSNMINPPINKILVVNFRKKHHFFPCHRSNI